MAINNHNDTGDSSAPASSCEPERIIIPEGHEWLSANDDAYAVDRMIDDGCPNV